MGLFDIFSKKSTSDYNAGEEYYQKGEEHWKKEEYFEAFMCYCEAVKYRHADAQFSLGYCFRKGISCEKNLETAILWLEKAIKQGHVRAMLELAYIYDDQEESFYNKQKAIEYYERAANLGSDGAQYCLAFFYLDGDGVPQDREKAKRLWQQAANQGHKSSKHNFDVIDYIDNDLDVVALNYIYGEKGLLKNIPKGLEILEKGVSLNINSAHMFYGLLKIIGVPGYLEKDFDEGVKHLVTAAKDGCHEAYIYVMQIYKYDGSFPFQGEKIGELTKNYELAGKYAVEIADEADEGYNLTSYGEIFGNAAWAYYYGYGVEPDLKKSYEYIKKSNYHLYPHRTTAEMVKLLSEKGFNF